jgi:hypothetical protein
MINGLGWANPGFAGAPIVCPTAPFDPSTLSLSLWLEGRDCPGAGINWQSRASAGTSGAIVTDFIPGFPGPQAQPKPLAVAPCGLATAEFTQANFCLLKVNQASPNLITPGDGTYVCVFKYILGRDNIYGPQSASCLVHEYNDNIRVQMTAAGEARLSVNTAGGNVSITTANTVSPGDWAIVVAQFDSSGTRIRLNRGTWATSGVARAPTGSGLFLLGADATFGATVDHFAAVTIAANSYLSAGDISDLEGYGEWYINTTV